jgi:hypothetical protein
MKEEGEGSIKRSQWNVSGVADGIQFNVELEAAEIPHPSKFWAYTSSSPDNLAYWSTLLERAPMNSSARHFVQFNRCEAGIPAASKYCLTAN